MTESNEQPALRLWRRMDDAAHAHMIVALGAVPSSPPAAMAPACRNQRSWAGQDHHEVMNENPEELTWSTNPNFPGYAERQDEGEWLVRRRDGAQVGFISATDIPEMFDVASVPHGANRNSTPVEVVGFQEALAHCLKNFRPSPI